MNSNSRNGSNHAPSSISRRRWLGQAPLSVMAAMSMLEERSQASAVAPTQHETEQRAALWQNVLDFGARGDGVATDTAAVQAAVDRCAAQGGGTVLLPPGTFRVGSIELKSYVTLHIASGATLLGTEEAGQYRAVGQIPLHGDTTLKDGNWALLYAVGAKNIAIEGRGTIDGQGALFRGGGSEARLTGTRRPYHFLAYRCDGISLCDLRLIDSAYHSVRIIESTHVNIAGLYIHSRVNVNNDGFHFVSSKFVTISNCTVFSQDDACALFGSCSFVAVTNSFFSTRWSVFRFGGGAVRNVTVSNCILSEVYGCPIKFQGDPGSTLENVSFSNLTLDNVTGPIYLSIGPAAKRSDADNAAWQNGSSASSLSAAVRNVSFDNIRGTIVAAPRELSDSPIATHAFAGETLSCIVVSSPEDAVMQGISFSNIYLVFAGGGTKQDAARRDLPLSGAEYFTLGTPPAYGLYVRGVRGLLLQNIRFETSAPDMRPAVVFDHVRDAAIDGMSVQSNLSAESALRFVASEDILLAQPRLLSDAQSFLRVEGGASRSIVVDGGDISRAHAPITCAAGADRSRITLRES